MYGHDHNRFVNRIVRVVEAGRAGVDLGLLDAVLGCHHCTNLALVLECAALEEDGRKFGYWHEMAVVRDVRYAAEIVGQLLGETADQTGGCGPDRNAVLLAGEELPHRLGLFRLLIPAVDEC